MLGKGGPRGPLFLFFLFFYKASIVLIDFIAILLTPGIFLIQIVNANMYLIHFYCKNIKMSVPKVEFLKFQTHFKHSLFIVSRWNKLRCHQERLHFNGTEPDLKKKRILNNYYIYYIVQNFDMFFDIFNFFF